MTHRIECADVQEWAEQYQGEPFDAVLCDPPYEIGFMGKAFDRTGVAHDKETWRLIGQHLKPGAHLLAFGGTRTFHRLAVAIEDAGFEIRDSLCWLYGQGFPKSLDISKAIDKAAGHWRGRAGAVTIQEQVAKGTEYERTEKGEPVTAAAAWAGYGTALKPAWEPCILAMKPTDGTFAENAIRYGVAGLAIDDCRIGTDKAIPNGTRSGSLGKEGTSGYQGGWGAREATQSGCNPNIGRFPANVILDEESARALDEAVGERRSAYPGRQDLAAAYAGSPVPLNGVTNFGGSVAGMSRSDTGGASRFFYCAKSSRREREAGLSDAGIERNHHPTLKPLALCEYLARLILPPQRDTPRRLLVPFSGSGSEMIGALLAGWDEVVGIEREAEYVAIAEARLRHWTDGAQLELSA